MPRRNSTVEIVDGKVVFSTEILSYFESIRTEENSKYIDEYFNILTKDENINSEKFEIHHIRPCFTFKNDKYTKRKETKPLGDKFNGNLIKLSIYNHLFAHYYIWKIFNNIDSKESFQRMCGQRIDDLTEEELKNIAILKEECAKENKTEEEIKEDMRQWYEENKEHKLKKDKERYDKNREEILRKKKEYYENNREQVSKQRKEWREKHKEELSEKSKEYRENNKEKYQKWHKEYYENNKEEILKKKKEYRENNKEELSEKEKERRERLCYDPIEKESCSYSALKNRKSRYKEKYKDVILKDCIIQPQPQS